METEAERNEADAAAVEWLPFGKRVFANMDTSEKIDNQTVSQLLTNNVNKDKITYFRVW